MHLWNDNYLRYLSHMIGGLLLADVSDHLPVLCISNHNFTPQQDKKMNHVQVRKDTNMLLFKEKLNHQDWNRVSVSNDVHEAYNSILGVFMGFVINVFLLVISIITYQIKINHGLLMN